MSEFSSATTTFEHGTLNHGMPSLDRDEQGRDNGGEQAFVPEPGRGIALGVFLSVPLWLLLAWTLHAFG